MPNICIIAARSRNGVIGKDGKIPWKVGSDLAMFRLFTEGNTVVMGRKTYESIGRPLPNRRVMVITRNPDYRAPGCDVVHSLGEAIALHGDSKSVIYIAGGSEIYKEALPIAHVIIMSEIDIEVDGDAYFPDFSESEYVESIRSEFRPGGLTTIAFDLVMYDRVCS